MEDPNKWQEELNRFELLKEEEKNKLPFGYDYILENLENIASSISTNTLFQSGVLLGTLMQIIIENKEKG
jgi:hypothetical protein